MTRHRKFGIKLYSEVGSGFQASLFATKMATSTRGWTDRVTSAILEALRTARKLMEYQSENYKNRNAKKKHYEEIVEIPKDDIQDIDLAAVKAKHSINSN